MEKIVTSGSDQSCYLMKVITDLAIALLLLLEKAGFHSGKPAFFVQLDSS